jgi:hypothetical protein
MVQRVRCLASNAVIIAVPSSVASAKRQRSGPGKPIEDLDIPGGNMFQACCRAMKHGGWVIWKSFFRGCELAAHTRARFT